MLTRLGRHEESLGDGERAITFNQDPGLNEGLRAGRAVTLAHSGDWPRALPEVAALFQTRNELGCGLLQGRVR